MVNNSDIHTNHSLTEFGDDLEDYADVFTATEHNIILSVYLLMAVTGLVLNTLTIYIVKKGKSISSDIKISVINLAVADILMCVFDSSFLATIFFGFPFPQSVLACKIYRFFRRIGHHCSLLCSVVISLERFVAVFFPNKAAQYTRAKRLIVVGAVWFCAALPGIRGLISGTILEGFGVSYCLVSPSPFLPAIVAEWLLQLEYIVPALVIAVVYVAVFVKLNIRKTREEQSDSETRRQIDQVCNGLNFRNSTLWKVAQNHNFPINNIKNLFYRPFVL